MRTASEAIHEQRPFSSYFCGPAALTGLPPSFIMPAREAKVVSVDLPPAARWLSLARRALMKEDHEEALVCFDWAIDADPRLAMAHLGRAVCLAQLGRPKESIESLEVAIEAAHGQEEVLYSLARMCAAQGHVALASPLLVQAVQARPELEPLALKDALFADHPAYLAALGRL